RHLQAAGRGPGPRRRRQAGRRARRDDRLRIRTGPHRLSRAAAHSRGGGRMSQMNTASKKILIADDDASIRLVLSQAFTRLGYQVRATGNATTLLKWV